MRILPLLAVLALGACGLVNPDPSKSGVPTAPIASGPHNQDVSGDIDPVRGVTLYR